ncbi:hypothetical protein HanIR_Chr01g0005931 [Helianthus annuus]|nr:hypothetical protein HanIR_Chr01g0005931 [Helianthus annuus]
MKRTTTTSGGGERRREKEPSRERKSSREEEPAVGTIDRLTLSLSDEFTGLEFDLVEVRVGFRGFGGGAVTGAATDNRVEGR